MKQRDVRGLNPGPQDPKFEVLTTRSHMPIEFSIKGVVKLRENCLILKQILSTNSLRKCMEISVENLYAGIGAKRIKEVKGVKLWYYVSEI